MKKNIVSISLLCAALVLCASCEEEMEYNDPQYKVVTYMKNSGLTEISFYNVGDDIVYTTGVGRGGSDPALSGSVRLEPFTTEELIAYNDEGGTNYQMLPADCYSIEPAQLDFAPGQEYAEVKIVLKSAIGQLPNLDYVLPISLRSNNMSVNSNYERIVLHPTVVTPRVSFSMDATVLNAEATKNVPLVTSTYGFPVMLDYGDNTKDFAVSFETDETALQTLVDSYNSANGTSYQLLPSSAYSFAGNGTLSLTGGITSGEMQVQLVEEGVQALAEGNYLLPVRMTGCSGAPFDADTDDVRYLALEYSEMMRLALTGDNLTKGFEGGWDLAAMVDGSTDGNNYWYANSGSVSEYNGTKCVYFDIDMGGTYSEVELSYYCYRNGAAFGVPHIIDIYTSPDNSTWTKNTTYTDDGFKEGEMRLEVSNTLPKLTIANGGARYLRICMMDYIWTRSSQHQTMGWWTVYPITNSSLSLYINEIEVRVTPQ